MPKWHNFAKSDHTAHNTGINNTFQYTEEKTREELLNLTSEQIEERARSRSSRARLTGSKKLIRSLNDRPPE